MKITQILVFLVIAVMAVAGCNNPAKDAGLEYQVDLTATLEKSTVKDSGTTSLVMTARNTGTKAIVGASFSVVPEDPELVKITYESRKDFTLAPGESITKRYTVQGMTKIKASEVQLSVNLTSPGVGEYISLGHAQVTLRIEK
ncbi:MAG: hypothetical protein V1702_06525 [Candidatus Woesearchaeota archaeon]